VIYIGNPSGGPVEINATDFDPALHRLPDAPQEEVKKRGRPKSTEN
jgi:hypothetical protein